MLVAGVDVGNSTTEIAFARLEPGREPEFLLVLRTPSTGAKGSAGAATGVLELLDRGGRRLGERPGRLLLAEQAPAETGLLELGRLEEVALGGVAIARPASATPSGQGVGVGRLLPLATLGDAPEPGPVLALVDAGVDFEAAAAALRDARERGWRLAGALLGADDGVLVGNRVDRALPIVDEVDDIASLPVGAHAAIEVAPPGGTVAELSDPLRLAVLLGLDPAAARAARHAARAVAGHRTALVVRAPDGPAGPTDDAPAPSAVLDDGTELALDPAVPPPALGRVTALRAPGAHAEGLADAFWCALPAPDADPGLRRRLAHRRAVGVAILRTGTADDLLGALAGHDARVVATETAAAVRGAATTPGAGTTPFVLDLGGGTVDLHAGLTAVAAGAGELVTRVCAGLLGAPADLAERAKRTVSVRVETPFVLHHEDGSRSFLAEPAPPDAVARLCAVDGRVLRPLPAALAPEVWRALRREAKRRVLGANVRRTLDAAGGVPRGELVTLVGGCAADREVVEEVGAALGDLDVAVARGDVLGRHGPRAAVAVGLVLLAAAGGRP